MKKHLSLLFLLVIANSATAKTVRYELNITRETVNLSGKTEVDWALMVNKSIPAPTLEFTEGDDAEIIVKNGLKDEEVSIHWHGILLPPEMDGVAYVNTPPIFPGQSYTFRFKIRQHGTYWYHSHTMVQEQKGVYGAFIIHPKEKKIRADRELVVVLSDWSDENADQIMKNLRKDGDYYLYKKDSVRSWFGAIGAGGLGTYLKNEWERMGGMDLSDVGYDAFLINGKQNSQLAAAKPGERIRIRIINAAASSYFYVSLGQEPMTVVAADGIDIEPIKARELLMGMAETYDILFEVPANNNYELRATVQDVTGFASGWIGAGEKVYAPDKPKPDLYAPMDHSTMDHSTGDHSTMDHSTMDHSKMDHSKMNHEQKKSGPEIESLQVTDLRAKTPTTFEKNRKTTEIKLVLDGDMERYVWHLNGEAIHQDRTIEINEGEVIRFVFINQSMMHHPMHLHGHFFRVLNKHGDYSPLKHTVDVPPHGTKTIEFLANEPGEWMLHCHNLYHMKTGMARVVKYLSYKPKPEIAAHQKHDPHLHDHLYFDGSIEAATNFAKLDLRLSKTWDTLEAHVETQRYTSLDHLTSDLLYRRWFSNFLNIIVGATYFAEYEKNKFRGVLGVGYMLPLLIEVDAFVEHTLKFRVNVHKRFQWTSFLYTDTELTLRQEAKPEYLVSLMYSPSWSWAAGVNVNDGRVGAGLFYRF